MTESKKISFQFAGISFKQNPQAPEFFSFVGKANDLIKFCGVARKSEQFLSNYQRALDDVRVKNEIAPFFRIPNNSSPTAIVLSLHESPVTTIQFENISVDDDLGIELKKMIITLEDIEALDKEDVVQKSLLFLKGRLNSEIQTERIEAHDNDAIDQEHIEDLEEVELYEDDADLDEDDAVEREDNVDIGNSMLKDLLALLESGNEISDEVISTLREMLKPALVIDGQHRLFGAAYAEEDIPLLVCSIVNPDWKEQVFQFTVINDKARGIPKPFITSLASMSLTSNELDELKARLAQAGVKLWEVEVMQRMGYDQRSAFFQKIEFKVSGRGTSGLGYQTMKRIGRAWYEPKSHGLLQLMKVLYNGLGEKKSNKTLLSDWHRTGDWFDFYCIFWDSFKVKFQATTLWNLHSSMMIAVVLEQLQEVFLTYLSSVSALTFEKISEPDDKDRLMKVRSEFNEIVEQFTSKYKERHFPKKWALASLNHTSGKKDLQEYFELVRQGRKVHNHALVKNV